MTTTAVLASEPSLVCKTTCPYCGVGCGVDIRQQNERLTAVKGSSDHPANLGRLCVKGSALHETVDNDSERLLYAQVAGKPVALDLALDHVAQGFKKIIAEHGPDAVAFYVSGQLLTEDYYVANKLMKGFIGSGNIDTNSRLCMSSAVAAYKRAFGSDAVPCNYEDIEQADLVVLVGSNAAWTHPVLYQRLMAARKQRPEMKLVVIDPRKTASCDQADLWLGITAGTDAFLFNGLLAYLAQVQALDHQFILSHSSGFEATLQQAFSGLKDVVRDTAEICGVSDVQLQRFFQLFRETRHTLTLYSQGVNQSSTGVDKCNAIINCHLATGRIGAPGMGPFSLTGQPNAMGGREVGGLANQLAAHMDFTPEAIDRVGRFWGSGNIATQPGLKAVELFQAIESGKVKAVWIMATNPVVSLPDADQVVRALKQCELVVLSDCFSNAETSRYADVILPAAGWGEKEGTVTNSERRISRQKAFLPLLADIKPDWWWISQVAQRMGFGDAFNYQHPADIFREHAALSGFENCAGSDSARDFDIHLLADLTIAQYDTLKPIQWPVNLQHPLGTARLFTDHQFYTADGRARFVPIQPQTPALATSDEYPFIMNTGRSRDQWHTMTRTSRSERLLAHHAEPYVEMHPQDAEQLKLQDRQLVALKGQQGQFIGRLQLTSQQVPGSIFVPIHWNRCFSAAANVGSLINPITDPLSGQPEFKHSPVQVSDAQLEYCGFILTAQALSHSIEALPYWTKIPLSTGQRYEVADYHNLTQHNVLKTLQTTIGEWLFYQDEARQIFRAVCLQEGRLMLVIATAAQQDDLPTRAWLSSLLGQPVSVQARRFLLAGQQADQVDAGRTVCACFQVGANTIRNAVQSLNLNNTQALGKALGCGTNCGSCLPELRAIIADCQSEPPVEAASTIDAPILEASTNDSVSCASI